VIASLLAPLALGQTVDGFVELRAQVNTGVDGFPALFVQRFRPELQAPLAERLMLVSTVELGLAQGRNLQDELQRTLQDSDFGPLLEAAGCTWPQEENEVLHISSASDYLSVERLYLDAYLPRLDLRVGRQALNWGSAFLVNPTDPFPEVLLLEPWRPRRGVNALRGTVPFSLGRDGGEDHQVQAVVGADDTLTRVRLAGRATVNVAGTDFSAVGAWRQESEEGIVGLDVRGTLGVGFWAEGALHVRDELYEELVLGVDYSLPVGQALVFTAQYYRNGAGSPEQPTTGGLTGAMSSGIAGPECTSELFPAPETEPDPFAPVFRGQDYVIGAVNFGIVPELSLSSLWVQNLGDGTALFVPGISSSPTGWLMVAGSASVPVSAWGEGGELRPNPDDLSQTIDVLGTPLTLDLDGLAPSATFSVWTRVNF
jgi:hypothetical protein